MKALRAFTLIEVLVALLVFAILSGITSALIYQALNTKKRVNEHAAHFAKLEIALTLIDRDLRQIISGSTLNSSLFLGESQKISFISQGYPNPNAILKKDDLAKITYTCENHTLTRRTEDPFLINTKNVLVRPLLSHLKRCEFLFLDAHLETKTSFENHEIFGNATPLPMAIRLIMVSETLGEMTFLFLLPHAETPDGFLK